MGCGTGSPIEYSWENVIPPWQQQVAEPTGGLIQQQLGQPATPFPGPLATGMDPLMTMGAGALAGMMGQPYNPPPYMTHPYGTPGMPGWGYNQYEWEEDWSDYTSGPPPIEGGPIDDYPNPPHPGPKPQPGPWPPYPRHPWDDPYGYPKPPMPYDPYAGMYGGGGYRG